MTRLKHWKVEPWELRILESYFRHYTWHSRHTERGRAIARSTLKKIRAYREALSGLDSTGTL